jgi:hypothetical protein
MKVMGGMAESAHGDQEPEPGLDELVAAFEAGEPVQLVRSARRLIVEYRYGDGRWKATSPDLTGFEVSAPSLRELRREVKGDLARYLDPGALLDERVPDDAETAGASRGQVMDAPLVVTSPSSVSRNRVAVSPGRLVSA